MTFLLPRVDWTDEAVANCVGSNAPAVVLHIAARLGCTIENGRISQSEHPAMQVLQEAFVNASTAADRLFGKADTRRAAVLFATVQRMLEAGEQVNWSPDESHATVAAIWREMLQQRTMVAAEEEEAARSAEADAGAESEPASDHIFTRSQAAELDSWMSSSLLSHWRMYCRAFSRERATRTVSLTLRVEAPRAPRPLRDAKDADADAEAEADVNAGVEGEAVAEATAEESEQKAAADVSA